MMRILSDQTQTLATIVEAEYTTAVDVSNAATLSVQSVADVNTPSADTFVDGDVTVAADTVTLTAHGFHLGLKLQLTTSGTLPAGLSLATDYFIINTDANTVQFATTLANAQAGTAVTITAAAGGGTHTATSVALAGATVSFQRCNKPNAAGDGPSTTAADWADIDTATAVTVDATNWFTKVGPEYHWFRIKGLLTAGSITFTNYVLVTGEDKN